MTRNKGCSQTLYASASIWSNSGMWVTPSPQEAIWLFPLPFSLSKAKRCQPGHHLLPTEPSTEQGHQRLSCCCCRCALSGSRTGSSGGRSCTGREWGMCCQEAAKVQPPKSSPQGQSQPLATVLLFQRGNPQLFTLLVYPSTELGTGI